MMTTTIDLQKSLERLLLSEDLEELNNLTSNFNVFKALKLKNNEVKHSNFLGWLLNPNETHKLGDYFLKEVLKIALRDYSTDDKVKATISDVIFNDFSDTEIILEKLTDKNRRMDIVIDSPKNQFVCVIENKINAGEGYKQLEDYETFIKNDRKYKKYKNQVFIFLTPKTDYNKSELYKNYIQINYGDICEAIKKLLKFKSQIMNSEVRVFIEHYKKMIERDIMGQEDEKIERLCRKIYRENREAIDLLTKTIERTPRYIDNLLKKIISEDNKLKLIENSKKETGWIRFVSNSVNTEKLQFAKEDWVESKEIIMIEINNTTHNELRADIIVRTVDEDSKLKRKEIIDIAKNKDIGFDYDDKDLKETDYAHVFSVKLIENDKYFDVVSDENLEVSLKEALYGSSIIKKLENFIDNVNKEY